MIDKRIMISLLVFALGHSAFAESVPIPKEKPATQEQKTDSPSNSTKPEETEALPVSKEDPAELQACLSALKASGTKFEKADDIDDGGGCGIDKPITVSEILHGIKITPKATIRCQTALQLARWTKQTVLPAAKIAFDGETVTSIQNAYDYVCRRRNNAPTGKLSEHARGNALDIGGFTLSNGKTVNIKPRDDDSTLEGAFQRTVRASACLYFTTALGPGSDRAHKTHLHLDILERRGGYRYCR